MTQTPELVAIGANPRVFHSGGVRPPLRFFAFKGDGGNSTIDYQLVRHGICVGVFSCIVSTVAAVSAKSMLAASTVVAGPAAVPTWSEDFTGLEVINVSGSALLYNSSVNVENDIVTVTPHTRGTKIPVGAYPTGAKIGWVG